MVPFDMLGMFGIRHVIFPISVLY